MKLFVIHRFRDRKQARSKIKELAREFAIEFQLVFLDSSGGDKWQIRALRAIDEAEAVIVFNRPSCEESKNATWEIERAKYSGKKIIDLTLGGDNQESAEQLKLLYDMKDEFDVCFSSNNKDALELYKIMIESSESLIQRRQKTNAFFITVIGSLIAIAGLLVKASAINNNSYRILYCISVVSLLLCNSWRNLIDNYGKLNKSKFDVILRLEKDLGAQIYSAEWAALGQGVRPKKYKSFTSTEKNVPLYFSLLITVITLMAIIWQIWG